MPEALIGWRPCSPQAALAFFPPEPLEASMADALPPLAPAGGLAQRIFQVRCPYDLTIRRSPSGMVPVRFERVPNETGLSQAGFDGLVTPIDPTAQRAPARPAVQISLNLMLVTEAEAVLTLTPPFMAPGYRDWPGSLVSGRFPLRAWPRPLNAVLEWQDPGREWVLRRGDPMAYLWLTFPDPDTEPRMVEAAMTPALKRHFAQVDNVSSFGRNVAPMFAEAEARRPARLLVEKKTGCPEFS
ncbi:MAG: hypothetical protein AAFR17_20270 [Pseudomonadota bacterium]